jgi:hypothetical protein
MSRSELDELNAEIMAAEFAPLREFESQVEAMSEFHAQHTKISVGEAMDLIWLARRRALLDHAKWALEQRASVLSELERREGLRHEKH